MNEDGSIDWEWVREVHKNSISNGYRAAWCGGFFIYSCLPPVRWLGAVLNGIVGGGFLLLYYQQRRTVRNALLLQHLLDVKREFDQREGQ